MEKWKIIVVLLLLGGLGGYGYFQQNPTAAPPSQEETPTPPPNVLKNKYLGQVPPAWNIDAKFWVNAPQPITQESLKGNVAIVEFWRIGCHHCEATVPFLNDLYKKNQAKGLKMVTIHSPGNLTDPENPEGKWDVVKDTIKQWGITYPVAYDEGGKLFKETYGGDTYPTLMILGRDGKVKYLETGHTPEKEQALIAALDKELKAK